MLVSFNPNAAADKNAGIFGLPYTAQEAKLILIPIPWEVTTSYGSGTAKGPQAIYQASKQVDLFDHELGNFFTAGIHMLPQSKQIQAWNKAGLKAARPIIEAGGCGEDTVLLANAKIVNQYSEKLNQYIYQTVKDLLAANKCVGLVGGDHATPFGAIQAFLEKYPHMGILHIDAHADMRQAYEGFEYSHASIMYNVMTKTALQCLVQVGIRDFCEEEVNFLQAHTSQITTFFDIDLFAQKAVGKNWAKICDEIISNLPPLVYISLDIDGLDPRFCPHTGTPVPGGLDFYETLYLFKAIIQSDRKIIGFDLNEVAPPKTSSLPSKTDTAAEWDANVAARLLYKLCGWTLKSMHLPSL